MKLLLAILIPGGIIACIVLCWPDIRDLWVHVKDQRLSASDGHHIDEIEQHERESI